MSDEQERCLRCAGTSSYRYMVKGGGYLCPPCCALVDPERVRYMIGDYAVEEGQAKAERSDEEWEALGWSPPASVTSIEQVGGGQGEGR